MRKLVILILVVLVALVLFQVFVQVFEDGSVRAFGRYSACLIVDWGCGEFEWFHEIDFSLFPGEW